MLNFIFNIPNDLILNIFDMYRILILNLILNTLQFVNVPNIIFINILGHIFGLSHILTFGPVFTFSLILDPMLLPQLLFDLIDCLEVGLDIPHLACLALAGRGVSGDLAAHTRVQGVIRHDVLVQVDETAPHIVGDIVRLQFDVFGLGVV